jgi:beta-mannosidase
MIIPNSIRIASTYLLPALLMSVSAAEIHIPTNEAELQQNLSAIRQTYAPFLRSLPQPLPARERTALPTECKFTFEAKEPPKEPGIPIAPAWHGIGFDDSQWEKTTVPEWRYRTNEGDETALQPEKLDAFRKIGTPANTICWYRTTFPAAPTAAGNRQWLCFDGVDWEAQVYLNGELLGDHRVYFEPFRFDVTGKLKESNTLAVRVIAGPAYGEPVSYWGMFPDIRAAKQRYTPDRAQSIPGNLPIGYHSGCGFGIFREVYLEQTGATRIAAVFARNENTNGKARVKIELDRKDSAPVDLSVELLPENFEGPSYKQMVRADAAVQTLEIPMPGAKSWSPESPNLYRCRVTVAGSDARDVLFGCRSFELARGHKNLPDGSFLLNGQPAFLRGTNVHGLNLYSYWGQKDQLVNALLLLKAGRFNAVRSCQHVEFPEVRELMDRFGMMSEQDMGGGRAINDLNRTQYAHTGSVLARETYNNPGVVLLSLINEHEYATEPIMRVAQTEDPQRIFKPISGRITASKKVWDLPQDLQSHAVDDGHPYTAWYGKITPQSWNNLVLYRPNSPAVLGGSYGIIQLQSRPVTLGEFGAEASDAYETMRDHYPPQFKPPAADTDTQWATAQLSKRDIRQISGLGRDPKNLAEYIEASQNYQEATVADQTIGMRLSPQAISGYFHFHFLDVVPAFWPKSIVSHDHKPKKAYYQIAQINQPVVPLPQLAGTHPDAMTLWVANDLPEAFPQASLRWTVRHDGQTLIEGRQTIDVPAVNAVAGNTVDLSAISAKYPSFDLELSVSNSAGKHLSSYRRTVRVVPSQLIKKTDTVVDPFNTPKPQK